MGRNKQIRKVLAGLERQIRSHETKIRSELARASPSDEFIAGWVKEIEGWKKQVALLERRLRKDG